MSTKTQSRPRAVARDGYVGDPANTRGGVRKIEVPPEARELGTLEHLDYEDAYLVNVGNADARTAQQWARAIFDDAPNSARLRLWSAWIMLGLRLASPRSSRHVLGWEIRKNTPDFVLLGARSRIGMPAELLIKRQADAVLFDTFVQQRNPLARRVWAGIDPVHRAVVPSILRQLGRRVKRDSPAGQ